MRLPVLLLPIVLLSGVLLTISPKFVSAETGETHYIAAINSYRQSKGIASLKTDPYTCRFAELRAREAANNFSHNGFYSRVSSRSLPYPSYRLVTENLAWASSGQNVVDMWIASPAHAANLLKNTDFGCVGRSGDYYAFEGWRI